MAAPNFPSPERSHRRADLVVHLVGLALILTAAALVLPRAAQADGAAGPAIAVYLLCILVSNVASSFYHFAPWHAHRLLLRRLDHAAIYTSIAGTFTPLFVLAGTSWALTLLYVCWGLTVLAVWNKITNATVKSRWSTASYIGLGAVGMAVLPELQDTPQMTVWLLLAGAASYVVGTIFYARRSMRFRYAIWHLWVNLGGILMFLAIWMAVFPPR